MRMPWQLMEHDQLLLQYETMVQLQKQENTKLRVDLLAAKLEIGMLKRRLLSSRRIETSSPEGVTLA
jgi:hypothetical protein